MASHVQRFVAADCEVEKAVVPKARERLREESLFLGKAAGLMESLAMQRGVLWRNAGSYCMKCKYDDCCFFHGR